MFGLRERRLFLRKRLELQREQHDHHRWPVLSFLLLLHSFSPQMEKVWLMWEVPRTSPSTWVTQSAPSRTRSAARNPTLGDCHRLSKGFNLWNCDTGWNVQKRRLPWRTSQRRRWWRRWPSSPSVAGPPRLTSPWRVGHISFLKPCLSSLICQAWLPTKLK